jgi:hypothetical protein
VGELAPRRPLSGPAVQRLPEHTIEIVSDPGEGAQ